MNDTINYSIMATLLFSNITLATLYLREKHKKSKDKKDSYEAEQLLLDLLAGEAMVKITRIVPGDVFLRSPRGSR